MADVDVTLGLNANELNRELSEAKTKLSGFATTLTSLGAGFLSGFGVDKIQAAVTSALAYGSTIQDLSEKFGVSAETIQRFGNVAEKNGASLESVAKAFKFLEVNREKALADPTGKQADAFEGLGISISDLESLNADEIMVKIGQSSLNAADLVGVLGKSALDLRTTLAQIADSGFGKEPIVSDEDIARIDQFDDGLKSLQQSVKALTVILISELVPALGDAMFTMLQAVAPTELLTKAFDKTPVGEAAAPEDTALAKQLHDMRERQAGEALPEELAPAAEIAAPEKKKKRSFGEAEGELAEEEPKATGPSDRGLLKGELDVIGADLESKEETQKDVHAEEERVQKEEVARAKQEASTIQKNRKIDEAFAKNPAGLSLQDYATKGAGHVASLAQEATREENIAKQRQLVGDFGGAKEHQSRAEQLKKQLGLPSKEDQKDAIKQGLNDAKVLKDIEINTRELGANK